MAIVEFLFGEAIENFLARIFGPSFKKLARADKFWTILTIILLLVGTAFLLMTAYTWLTT
ncbi:hypothetical protein A3850_006530 [Lewinella sp. 4G2]|nr:hypothetical protein A3850_006530 [Lewinella sp. 4G2]